MLQALARAVRVGIPGGPPTVEPLSDGEDKWSTSDGRAVKYLDGCEYADIFETLFTNTLPIRRLDLSSGESADVPIV